MSESERQRRYLRDVMQRTGLGQSELASRSGIDPSTLSRFLSGDREGHSLRSSTLRKIETFSGLPFNPDGAAAPPPADGFGEAEAVPLRVTAGSGIDGVLDALLKGKHNVDPWVLRSKALEGAGYRIGDILLVALGETPLAGDVVCAQVYDWETGRAETVFRLFQPPYLLAASTDIALMRPHHVDDGKVSIKGVVINSLRNRQSH